MPKMCPWECFEGLSFTPKEAGDHFVSVFRNGQPIPNSPFRITISATDISISGGGPADASKVRVKGRALLEGVANEFNQFSVDAKEAGLYRLLTLNNNY